MQFFFFLIKENNRAQPTRLTIWLQVNNSNNKEKARILLKRHKQ